MTKSIRFKITLSLISVLIIMAVILQFVIISEFKSSHIKSTSKQLQMLSQSMFQTIRGAMNTGQSKIVQNTVKQISDIKGVQKFKIYKSKKVAKMFNLSRVISLPLNIQKVFKTGQDKQVFINHGNTMEIIKPLIAKQDCINHYNYPSYSSKKNN